jgi:hypothetical protein
MPVIATEPKRLSGLAKYEFEPSVGFCRKVITLNLASETELSAFTVLGKTYINGAGAAVADSGNTGDGLMGAITVADGTTPDLYTLTVISESSDAGGFEVRNSSGALIGTGTVAAAFSGGGLSFTLADGAEDFDTGDKFYITVTADEDYVPAVQTATDGSQNAAAIFIGTPNGEFGIDLTVAATTDTDVICYVKGPLVVGKDALVLDASYNTDAEKNKIYAGLDSLNIQASDQY